MSELLTPRKTKLSWAVELPPEMAEVLGVPEGSLIVLHAIDGSVETEILPLPSPEFAERVQYILEKNKETFEELKRLGD
ncbi:MAG: hypothetical protein M3R15_26515 [Acidobacteriota bacterium]|nr:hypothetical protein [Acidobacteriota bacterium]